MYWCFYMNFNISGTIEKCLPLSGPQVNPINNVNITKHVNMIAKFIF